MGIIRGWSILRLVRLVLVVSMLLALISGAFAGELDGWISSRSGCKGRTIGECLGEEEFAVDTDSSRRILALGGYISYGALRRGSTPCSLRGASYYNCRPGAPANPYNRGCSAITRCRS
ncbi:rapid alkalinization factor-like [Wolffia australiana]